MSTDEQAYSPERLLFMARMHQRVIDYHNFVLDELKPSQAERSRILAYIQREQKALAEIEKLGAVTVRAARRAELPADLGHRLLRSIEEP